MAKISPLKPLPEVLVGSRGVERPRKRERTQRQLVDAAIRVFSVRGLASATMQEIADEAGVTTGTVYNHFDAKADIVAAVAVAIAEDIRERSAQTRAALKRGVERVAAGCQRYLWLAEKSPGWAILLLDVAAAAPDFLWTVSTYVRAELRLGVLQKDLQVENEAAALDLINGCVMQGMRRIAQGKAPAGHGIAVTATVLRGLGVPRQRAREVARKARAALPR